MDVLLSRDLVVINPSFLARMPRMSVFKLARRLTHLGYDVQVNPSGA